MVGNNVKCRRCGQWDRVQFIRVLNNKPLCDDCYEYLTYKSPDKETKPE